MRLLILALTVATAALLPALAPAQTPTPPERDENVTVLHLTERGERMVKRDRLIAELRVEADDPDPARIQAEINRRMAAALGQAKAVSAVAASTGGYSVYQQQQTSRARVQWHGSQSLLLASRDATPLLALTGTLQQEGLILSSLGYALTPEAARSVEDELTSEALSRLRERAERIAGVLGLSVGRWRNVQVGNADGARPLSYAVQPYEKMAAPAPVAQPGDATVSVSVTAEVLLSPRR